MRISISTHLTAVTVYCNIQLLVIHPCTHFLLWLLNSCCSYCIYLGACNCFIGKTSLPVGKINGVCYACHN